MDPLLLSVNMQQYTVYAWLLIIFWLLFIVGAFSIENGTFFLRVKAKLLVLISATNTNSATTIVPQKDWINSPLVSY